MHDSSAQSQMRVVVATSNPGKVREMTEALSGLPWVLLPMNDPLCPP
ncbi:hypothetical protein [Deinococcus sp. KNUC1210]